MGDLSFNFSRHEFKCKCNKCDFDTVDYELIIVLEEARIHFNQPITINSGCRCYDHNLSEDGSQKSLHLDGKAADIVVNNIDADIVYEYLNNKYWNKYGIGRYNGRTHIDVRPNKARWDKRKEQN